MTLADRMKNYENVERKYLYNKFPIVARVDSMHGHTNFAQWVKPWDDVMEYCMNEAAIYVCEHLQGVKLAYIQSDEISFLITNLDTLEAQLPFNGNLQKIVSATASFATMGFNLALKEFIRNLENSSVSCPIPKVLRGYGFDNNRVANKLGVYKQDVCFDSRAFNLPIDEVNNYFIWRQNDATRNSIESWGQYFYSHKELMGINCNQLQDKMLTEKDFNWNNLPVEQKRGRCAIRVKTDEYDKEGKLIKSRNPWKIDNNIPIFSAYGQNYIGSYLPPVSNTTYEV